MSVTQTDDRQEAIFDKFTELQVLEHNTSLDVALRASIAQMCGCTAFIEARAGKAKATKIVRELYRSMLIDPWEPVSRRPARVSAQIVHLARARECKICKG